MTSHFDLFLFAGEPSGDKRGAELLEELFRINPKLSVIAVAGPEMRKFPITVLLPMEHFEVMGFTDIVSSLPRLIKTFFFLRNKILKINPLAAIFIDYPGFTLRLEKSLRKKQFLGKIIHYVCPTVWAWGKKRIPIMEKTIDLLLCLLPFEPNTFKNPSFDVRYVGHPLTKKVIQETSPKNASVLGLFPGSRKKEILRNFPLQWKAVETLYQEKKILSCHISIANPEVEALILDFFKQNPPSIPFVLTKGSSIFSLVSIAIATAGTITLELALHKIPSVVTYAIDPLDLFLAQRIFHIHLPFYSLVNILGQKEIFPELFGPYFTLENVMKSLHQLESKEKQAAILQDCEEISLKLGKKDAAKEAAKAILSKIQ